MAKISRSLSKSACLGLALALVISMTPRPAMAQWAVTDISMDTILTSFQTFLGELEENNFSSLGGTLINASAVTNAINGKIADFHASTAYVMEQQKAQATEQGEAGTGNLAFMHNALCGQASVQAGGSQMEQASKTELASYNGYMASVTGGPASATQKNVYQGLPGSGYQNGSQPICTTCGGGKGPAGVIGYEYTKDSQATRVMDLAKTATAFFGTAEGGTDGSKWNSSTNLVSSTQMWDNDTPTTHLDVDVLDLAEIPTYTDVEQAAHDQLSNYIVGLPNDIVSSASTFKGSGATITPQFASAIISNREKTAYRELSSVAWDRERTYHDGVISGNQSSVTAIFGAAGLKDPSWVDKNGDHLISPAAVDQALYEEPADDASYASNFTGQNAKTLLAFIANEMLLLNRMEYKRYLQEMEMYKVQSASLNLQARTFNFASNP